MSKIYIIFLVFAFKTAQERNIFDTATQAVVHITATITGSDVRGTVVRKCHFSKYHIKVTYCTSLVQVACIDAINLDIIRPCGISQHQPSISRNY